MTDVHNKKTRSYNMAQIKGKDTKPELLVRKYLYSKGFRYRLHDPKLPGKPDIVLRKYNTVIFVNGCFWHGHIRCKYFTLPKTRTDWWESKIKATQQRDNYNYSQLKKLGWDVIVVWECQLKTSSDERLRMIEQELKGKV